MKPIKDTFLKSTSPSQPGLIDIYHQLTPSQKRALETLVYGLPKDASLFRALIKMAKTQYQYSFGTKKKVAILGPANVGKSTLFNQFVQEKADHAEVSPIPGTTKISQNADAGLFFIIDTPGTDAIGIDGKKQYREAVNSAHDADFLIIMFDATQGIRKTEQDTYLQFTNLKKPYVLVMNKVDRVSKDIDSILQNAAENLNLPAEEIIPISARDGKNLSQLFLTIASIEPGMIAVLGQALPKYRRQLAWKTITSAASLSAVIALTPLPVIDFVPLIANQSMMILGIARIYNHKIDYHRAKELIATFGLGFLGRTLFQELSKFGGFPGWLLSSAIAASTTMVMGYAAARWFENGERITQETMKSLLRKLTIKITEALKNIGKPGKKQIQEIIIETLEDSEFSENLSSFEENKGI